MRRLTMGILALSLAATALPVVAQTRAAMPGGQERPVLDPDRGTLFHCAAGGDLLVHMVTQNAQLVAIVDPGDGPHRLNLHPWKPGDLPEIRWTDGRRTLTWSPGVQIMWMDGSQHRDCGRSGAHNH